MKDFFAFRKMITPSLIRILFVIGLIILLILGIIDIAQGFSDMDYKTVLSGFAMIIFGPIVLRFYMEIIVVMFMINDTLKDIRKSLVESGPVKVKVD